MAGLSKRNPWSFPYQKAPKHGLYQNMTSCHFQCLKHMETTQQQNHAKSPFQMVQMGYLGWWWLKSFAIPSLKFDASNHGRTQSRRQGKVPPLGGKLTGDPCVGTGLGRLQWESLWNLCESLCIILGIFTNPHEILNCLYSTCDYIFWDDLP